MERKHTMKALEALRDQLADMLFVAEQALKGDADALDKATEWHDRGHAQTTLGKFVHDLCVGIQWDDDEQSEAEYAEYQAEKAEWRSRQERGIPS